jgi:hypothetical protein
MQRLQVQLVVTLDRSDLHHSSRADRCRQGGFIGQERGQERDGRDVSLFATTAIAKITSRLEAVKKLATASR